MSEKPTINPIKRIQDSQIENTNPSAAEKEEEEGEATDKSQTNEEKNPVQPYPDYEAEFVDLPSKGIFYKGRFKGLDKLKIRKLNYQDEDILTTKSYYENETLFNEILKGVIVDPNGFRSEQLVPVDRDAILMWLRIGAFGKDYNVPYACDQEECGKKDTRTWDLADIDMPEYNPKFEKELQDTGEVAITLPSGTKVKLTVPSTGRELEVKKMLDTEKRQLKTERNYIITGRLLTVISSVILDGKEFNSLKEIREWMRAGTGLSIIDSRYIQKMAKEIDVKIKTAKTFTCKHCGHVEEDVALPMTIYFFWPEYEEISGISN